MLKGETVKSWTQMITVTGAKGAAGNPKVSPEIFAGSIVGGFKSACPDSFAAQGFGPAKFGDQDAYVAVASCGRVESSADKHSEVALIVTVKGSADYYTLQWAERGPTAGRRPDRRGQMAGPAAPVAADPRLPDRARRDARPTRAAPARNSSGRTLGPGAPVAVG